MDNKLLQIKKPKALSRKGNCYSYYLEPGSACDSGFTLIELLVVIVIIGILGAIGLPSYLNQAAKVRGSEAMSNLGTINRGQQAYRLQQSTFANALTNLDARISGKFYTYTLVSASATGASATANTVAGQPTDLKQYSSAIAQSGDFFGQAICESVNIATNPGLATAPTAPNTEGSCVSGQGLLVQ
jgi:type IV pilus assembly protein PilA